MASNTGKIRANFDTLRDKYPYYNALPASLQALMDGLNGITPAMRKSGQPLPPQPNTPCCVQVSHALNSANEFIPGHGYRRANTKVGSWFYILAVDELEHYLAGRYGRGDNIRVNASGQKRNLDDMKTYIGGKQGILLFRNNGAGVHTEIWDKTTTLQNGQVPGVFVGPAVFDNPRVLFWEVNLQSNIATPTPDWLRGWWSVWDGNQYYYYFSNQNVVTYTKQKPKYPNESPQNSPLNEGDVSISLLPTTTVSLTWNEAGGGITKETFTRIRDNEMYGTSNRYSPLVAKKL